MFRRYDAENNVVYQEETKPLVVWLAEYTDWLARLEADPHFSQEWIAEVSSRLDDLESMLPSGSGIDSGTKIDRENSTPLKLVLTLGYHHMNDSGMYDGWTDHTVTVIPTFDGFDLEVSGDSRMVEGEDDDGNPVEYDDTETHEEYLADTYHHALSEPVTMTWHPDPSNPGGKGIVTFTMDCYTPHRYGSPYGTPAADPLLMGR